MAKTSQIDRIVAEWNNEKIIVESLVDLIDGILEGKDCKIKLMDRADMLNEMISRASTINEGKEERAPKPTRTRTRKPARVIEDLANGAR